ncbi:cyclase family protein [Methanothermobacter thermautotrophicus]|uniref:cyclase family protein n=1 Tax=Methanothermobacter thermautotrophicus TaxID=145262 RepID=UPI0022B9A0D6|nr:cyclase family protein [Methanothermobacter thermautotrophicus]WBF08816.1 cyclase family protein [Methanothermobacter thermautotrophicus]
MKIIDLTHKIEDSMPVFPGDPPVKLRIESSDAHYITSSLSLGMHTGTHIDAPLHAHCSALTVDGIGLEELTGEGFLVSGGEILNGGDIAVIRTGWSSRWGSEGYFRDYPGIKRRLAEELVEHEVLGVCIDGPSVDRPGETDIHRLLLKNGIWIVENITNTGLLPPKFRLFVVPLSVRAEASPARVFAVTGSGSGSSKDRSSFQR